MTTSIFLSILVCTGALAVLVRMLREDHVSLGLPVAYLSSLLLIHVPGAITHLWDSTFLTDPLYTEIGIRFTAIGSVCFIAGVWLARRSIPATPILHHVDRRPFWVFCLLGGWLFTYGLSPLRDVPSVGAAIDKGGAIWMLGALFGLRYAVWRGNFLQTVIWFAALSVFPVLMLMQGGFLSYGSAAAIVVCSVFAISARRLSRVIAGFAVITFLGLTLFVNYFENRNTIRDAIWFGAPWEQRADAVMSMFTNFKLFDPTDPVIAVGLDLRLNQNYFVGLAAHRIDEHETDYLYGRSVEDALLSLIPRAIWPDKTVVAGSPEIVANMTGLDLDPNTSWGVGNVMELQINFGVIGVILGFFGFGWVIAILDRKAAMAEASGNLAMTILCFLPAVAMIQPNGSFVELTGGAAAALVGAYVWKAAWKWWSGGRTAPAAPETGHAAGAGDGL